MVLKGARQAGALSSCGRESALMRETMLVWPGPLCQYYLTMCLYMRACASVCVLYVWECICGYVCVDLYDSVNMWSC